MYAFLGKNPFQTSPIITENNEEYVHHFLVYLCPPGQVVTTGSCGNLNESAQACRDSTLVGAWAVGGEVSDKKLVIPK